MFLRAAAVWVLLALVAVLNGALRNAWLTPSLGEGAAHVVSTLILCALIFLVAAAFIRWIRPLSLTSATMVGLMWALLTLAFEFLAGRYVFGHPWQRMVADYNITQGRIWILVPIVTYLAPRWALRVRGVRRVVGD